MSRTGLDNTMNEWEHAERYFQLPYQCTVNHRPMQCEPSISFRLQYHLSKLEKNSKKDNSRPLSEIFDRAPIYKTYLSVYIDKHLATTITFAYYNQPIPCIISGILMFSLFLSNVLFINISIFHNHIFQMVPSSS